MLQSAYGHKSDSGAYTVTFQFTDSRIVCAYSSLLAVCALLYRAFNIFIVCYSDVFGKSFFHFLPCWWYDVMCLL